MKITSSLIFNLFLFFSLSFHTTNANDLWEGPDGPYIFYLPEGKIRIISVNEDGILNDTITNELDDDVTFNVISHNKKHRFPVKLHPVARNPWKYDSPEKVFVLGDPHGNIDCFINALQANGVIDNKYRWCYGNNHLMITGDIFDRGNDVVPIFWLVYKLEQEAIEAGGRVSFIYGNHEILVMSNDLRYMKDKYLRLAKEYESSMTYADFFAPDTELGRWLALRNTIEVIGKDLFVHAGISIQVYDTPLTIPQINEELSKGLHHSKKERNKQSKYSQLLYTTFGPVWYRGMVDAKWDQAITHIEDIDRILDRFDAERIIVGHTIFEDITTFFDGKVIAINVDNLKNRKNDKGRGILIEEDKTYTIYGDGRKTNLNTNKDENN